MEKRLVGLGRGAAFSVDSGMGQIGDLGGQRQIGAAEAVRVAPLVVRVLVEPGEGHVVARPRLGRVLPNRRLDASQADFVHRAVGPGFTLPSWLDFAVRVVVLVMEFHRRLLPRKTQDNCTFTSLIYTNKLQRA